ncbi:MAG: toll/interleukin-1 receptor domain-containing protein [Ruminococcus sp.]|nr:toll/interleukin-1 receptor domain-containing protein [Ruminococcus sp.]
MSTEYRYDAFISYRHTTPDKPLAAYLQRLLEAYVPPKGVAEGRRLRIFRDETELPTSSNLSNSIETALQQSRFLIVVCSPETEKSKWCMQEIEYFKQLHGGTNENIITMLAGFDGVISFPDSLRYKTVVVNGAETRQEVEPLAANACAPTLSLAKKKLRGEYLRLAAALLGCGYDDLYRREQRRQARRKTRIAIGAAAVMTFIAAISITSLLIISSQKATIEEDARKNLLREATDLTESGDVYGARQALLQAMPEGSPVLSSALNQAVSLTGAYTGTQFTAVKKISHRSKVQECYLMENGTRLLTRDSDGVHLWDTETAEVVKDFEGYNGADCSVYTNNAYETMSMKHLNLNSVSYTTDGSLMLNTDFTGVVPGKPLSEDALYLIDEQKDCLFRASPVDGSVLWEYRDDENSLRFYNCRATGDAVTVISQDTLRVLSTQDGSELASCPKETLEKDLGKPTDQLWYTDGYLVAFSTERFVVYRCDGKTPEKQFVSEKLPYPLLSRSFTIADGTLYVTGKYMSDTVFVLPFLAAYDLADGERLWYSEGEKIAGGDCFICHLAKENTGCDFDMVVAAVGSYLFVNDADTGKVYGNLTFSGNCTALSYAPNGKVYLINSQKNEICVNLTNYDGQSLKNGLHLFRTHTFGEEYAQASFDGGVYAGVKKEGSTVALYRTVENPESTAVYADENGLSDITFSPDGKNFALTTHGDHAALLVGAADSQPKEVMPVSESALISYAFFGNNRLAVNVSGVISIYDADTAEQLASFTDDYKTVSAILALPVSATGEKLFLKKNDGTLVMVDSSCKPVATFTDADDFLLSPSGDRILTVTAKASCLVNTATEARVTLAEKNLKTASKASAWSDDEATLYLLMTDGTVRAYDCQSGALIHEGSYARELTDILVINGSLCLVDSDGNLMKASFDGDTLRADAVITLDTEISAAGKLQYRATADKSVGILSGKLGSREVAWLIQPERFERVGVLSSCCGYDAENNCLFGYEVDTLRRYPLLNAAGLRARLAELL